MRNPLATITLMGALLAPSFGCGEGKGINLFTIEDDKELGAQLAAEIESDPESFPVLSRADYPEAYSHLDRIRDDILASGEVQYEAEFEWKTHIIHDDATLNAFAAPGGYIYVYTGLLRYLDTEDHFAGVLGHEIAHADRRHSTQQLSKAYGVSVLLGVIFGEDPGLVAEIAAGLAGLSFSRTDEADADEYSVVYLCETDYAADGAAGFFEKLQNEGSLEIPEFLSTHPSSETRVEDIHAHADAFGCDTDDNPDAQWQAFLDTLPPVETTE